jgi:tetratricopeptide (TPR) repeat protein
LYLKGRHFWSKRQEVGLKKGIEYFQKAIEKDPYYAIAYAGIADCYNSIGTWDYMHPRETFPQARIAAEKALELDDMLAEAHTSLGFYKYEYEWDFEGSEKEYIRALEINNNYSLAHTFYSFLLGSIGRFDDAITEIQRARQLDPLSVIQNVLVGAIYTYTRRNNEALEYYQTALEIDPNVAMTYFCQGYNYIGLRIWEKAIVSFNTYMTLSAYSPISLSAVGYAYGRSGLKEKALQFLEQLEKISKERYVSPFCTALIFAGLDDRDRAFAYLEKAFIEREPSLSLLRVQPLFDNLRDDPRFHSLVKKVGLPE